MAGSTIEAKLKIALQVAEAIAGLKDFRRELKATKDDAAKTTGSGTGGGAQAQAETTEAVNQMKRRSQAERQAADDRKRQDNEEADRKRKAAREAKRVADEEERQRARVQRDQERARRDQEAADKRAQRQKAYTGAALAPQVNDVFVGLTTGQSPLTVALQQGPQIVQIYGGLRNTFAALLSVLTPLRVVLGGVAAGFGLVAVQAALGYRESSQLNKALALSGNIANTSLGQINSLALGIAEKQRESVGFVREVLAQVINLSGQTDTTLGATSNAVVALAKLTGQSADEAVKGFENQADGITAWSTKANKAYNFLTAQQVAYIRSLEREGRTAEAIKFTNEQLASTLQQRSVPAIGSLERGWNEVGNALVKVLDNLKAIGRDETAEERLKKLRDVASGKDGETPFKNLGEALAFGIRGGSSTELGRAYLAELQARNKAEFEAAQSQANADALRKSESAAALREEQARIAREAKEFQQVLAGQRAAAAQQSLAQREAELDAQAALVQRAHAQERLSASDQALQLNAIDQRRAQAQQALAERLLEIERARTPSLESKTDVESQKTQLTQLQAQLIAARSRVATAVSEGQRLIDAEIARLDQELQRRQAENVQARSDRAGDPAERARLAAEAATADARRQYAELQRDIRSRQASTAGLAGSEGIQARLKATLDEAKVSLDELTRKAQLDSLGQQAAELQATLALREREIDQLVEQGVLTTEDAERRKLDAREKALPQLRQLLVLQQALAQTPGEINAVRSLLLDLDRLQDKTTEVERTLRGSAKSGFADLFNSVLTGSKSALEGVKDFASGVARAMLNIIVQRWAEKLANSLFGAQGAGGSGGGVFETFLSYIFAAVKHTGGVIGSGGGAMRAVSPLLFAGAQVLHSGGLVTAGMSLASNERPVIAEVGEEMLTADNPRHIRNFKGHGVTMNTSITVNGATGAEQTQTDQLEVLQQMMLATVEDWAAKQRRQGGMLSEVRSG
jgi:hypothetical protein